MTTYRQKRLNDELSKAYDSFVSRSERELARQYRRCARETKNQLIELYDEILNDTVLMSDFYRYDRYFRLINHLNDEIRKLGLQEIEINENKLINLYIETGVIIKESYGFAGDIDYALEAKRAIKQIWCADGKLWSDRVWASKQELIQSLESGIMDAIARGEAKDKIVAQMMDRFNVAFNRADCLVRTELSWVQNRSAIDRYKENGITHYEILDAEGGCDDCAGVSGKQFPIEDMEHCPPLHPNCKCVALPVMN